MQFKLYTFGNEKTLGELIQDQWTRLGIEVSVNHVDYSVIKEARKNNEQRHKYALQINKIVSKDAPLITTYPRPALTAVKNNVQGFKLHFI